MPRFSILSVALLAAVLGSATSLTAQRPYLGILVGLHLRAFADLPLEQSPLSFRAELFYNRLTSGPNTFYPSCFSRLLGLETPGVGYRAVG